MMNVVVICDNSASILFYKRNCQEFYILTSGSLENLTEVGCLLILSAGTTPFFEQGGFYWRPNEMTFDNCPGQMVDIGNLSENYANQYLAKCKSQPICG